MNTLIKRAMIAAGIATAMALPLAGQASDGTITFTGAVTESTCPVSVNGGGASNTVNLPTVDASALGGAAGAGTAAGTFFDMVVSGCTTQTDIDGAAPTHVQIYFEAGPTVDEATGGLINTTGAGYSNVEVKLYNASGSSAVGTQIMPGTGTNQPTPLLVAGGTEWFYASYSGSGLAAGVQVTAGVVSTSITYSLVYD